MNWAMARDALADAATDLGDLGDTFGSRVTDQTAQMGNLSWPLMYIACQGPYNTSLNSVRDASADFGAALTTIAAKLQEVKACYEELERRGEVH